MIELPADVREQILAAARAGAPDEICGVLGGSFDADSSRVRSQYPAENAARNPRTRYRLDPKEQLEIFDRLEARGEAIVGFYHSHPRGPFEPSDTDRELATWPNRSYLIVSLEADGSGDDGADSNGGNSSGNGDSNSEGNSSADNLQRARLGSWRWRDGADGSATDFDDKARSGDEEVRSGDEEDRPADEGHFERERIFLE